MGYTTRTTDWQVSALHSGSDNYEYAIAQGSFAFCFYSRRAGYSGIFIFRGGGLGLGDTSVEAPPENIPLSDPWTGPLRESVPHSGILGRFSERRYRRFSAFELDGAWGRIGTMGIGLATIFVVSAWPYWSSSNSDAYFIDLTLSGPSYSTGVVSAGIMTLWGYWSFQSDSGLSAPPPPVDRY
jgi:hypothetical protein